MKKSTRAMAWIWVVFGALSMAVPLYVAVCAEGTGRELRPAIGIVTFFVASVGADVLRGRSLGWLAAVLTATASLLLVVARWLGILPWSISVLWLGWRWLRASQISLMIAATTLFFAASLAVLLRDHPPAGVITAVRQSVAAAVGPVAILIVDPRVSYSYFVERREMEGRAWLYSHLSASIGLSWAALRAG